MYPVPPLTNTLAILTESYVSTAALGWRILSNIDLQQGVGVVVTPSPVGPLILLFKLREVLVFAMVLLYPHSICLVFVVIPLVVFVAFFVVVDLVIGA
jgi:hypothetical protein